MLLLDRCCYFGLRFIFIKSGLAAVISDLHRSNTYTQAQLLAGMPKTKVMSMCYAFVAFRENMFEKRKRKIRRPIGHLFHGIFFFLDNPYDRQRTDVIDTCIELKSSLQPK